MYNSTNRVRPFDLELTLGIWSQSFECWQKRRSEEKRKGKKKPQKPNKPKRKGCCM